jgi:pimeloyl-ACP methyl ester carboxylesterase
MQARLALGLAGVAAAAVYAAIAVYGAEKITRRAPLLCDVEPECIAPDWETARFRSRDGLRLEGWWFPAPRAHRALVLVHGHGQNRIDKNWGSDRIARAFLERGCSVLVFDLRGHGASAPSRQSFGVREKDDVLGALDFVERKGFAPRHIAFLGISYGGASVLMAAPEMPGVGAIVADSSFAEVWPVIAAEIPRQQPLLGRLRPGPGIRLAARVLHRIDLLRAAPVLVVAGIERPVLFIHGANDAYVPPSHSERLHAISRHPGSALWLVPGAGHAETFTTAPDEFIARVAAFLDAHIT